jgi:hypothetical protein
MRRARIALVLVGLLFVLPVVTPLIPAIGRSRILVVSGVVLSGVLVASIARKRHRTERRDDGGEGFWGAIPDWQYDGRFAEAGGLTRSEQSEAVEKVRTEAEEIDRNRR